MCRWGCLRRYRYLVMSSERRDIEASATLATANGEEIHWQRVLDDNEGDMRLLCHSVQRAKEEAMLPCSAPASRSAWLFSHRAWSSPMVPSA
ncbi:hypothetical protein AGMMS50256_16560 [Betaproteobacteria bacterium]|nr:hypothetical protein AGMMS50256_16560 [Betaproteobacteria bacterium]